MSRRYLVPMVLALTVACGRATSDDAKAAAAGGAGDSKASAGGTAGAAVAAPGVMTTQTARRDPCSWISPDDAARALGGSLEHAPTRVVGAENPTRSEDGDACLYELSGGGTLEPNVSIEVIADETGVMQAAFAGMANVEKEFRSAEAKGDTLIGRRWDFVSVIPGGLVAARKGRLGIHLVAALGATDRAMALAGAIVDGVADVPFAESAADPSVPAPSGSPDPCALITRPEAEALMGPLAVAPFRSRKSTALAYGAGASCAYFTRGHRALVITPTLRRGGMTFQMLAGVSGLMASVMNGATAPDTLDGPWEQIAMGTNGSLNLLKDDKMLTMQFQSSAADFNTAIKLARIAIPRL